MSDYLSEEKLRRQLYAIERQERILAARGELIPYAEMMTPDPNFPDDFTKTRYISAKVHKVIGAALEEVEAGRIKKLILTVPPRHGKTELCSKLFPSWFVGRDPTRSIVVCSYNTTYAEDLGRSVRKYMKSPVYQDIFPKSKLMVGSASAGRLETTYKGLLIFTGRDGTITGRGGDLVVIDDPIKNSDEARSPTIRDQVFTWYQRDVLSRSMTDAAAVIIIQTRWHEDDLVGRITDPNNPCYTAAEAEGFKIIDLPALATSEQDPMGRQIGEPLWPERFGRKWLLDFKARDPDGFSSLYQQQPAATDGNYFAADEIVTYQPNELPSNLVYYAASDHAVATKTTSDRSCIIVVGVDENDVVWIVDVWWKRAKVDRVVEAMLAMMKKYEPRTWAAEKAHIEKSIEPFLRKRMAEEGVYCFIKQLPGQVDKEQKAQALKGRMAMGMVRWPSRAAWFHAARDEMLKFPKARHDDFVDTLANISRSLHKMHTAPRQQKKEQGPPVGSWSWVKKQAELKRKRETASFARSDY